MARLHVWLEARADFRPLSQSERRVALQHIKKAMRSPGYGIPLDFRHGQDLRGCFKIYFSDKDEPSLANPTGPRRSSEGGATHRIVYLHNREMDRVEVIAVGRKPSVYERASDRQKRGDPSL